MPPLLNKQQTKSAQARKLICQSCVLSLVQQGYADTSINGVAKIAAISKGALQHHFPSKEDLMAATVDYLLQRTNQTPPHAVRSLEMAVLYSWHKLVNTPAYRALLEILNAARTDIKLQHRTAEQLQQWNSAIDATSERMYRSVVNNPNDVKELMTMTRSFLRGLVIQDRYGTSNQENENYVKRWVSLIQPLIELKDQAIELKAEHFETKDHPKEQTT